MRWARKTLSLLEIEANPVVTLNAEGMELPVPLLLTNDMNREDLLASGRTTVKIAWHDIASWRVLPGFRSMASSTPSYALTVKEGAILPLRDKLFIWRGFARKEEKSLLDFAQRFLSVPIKCRWLWWL